MQENIKKLVNKINPENFKQYMPELFYLIICENLALSEIEEIKEYIKEKE